MPNDDYVVCVPTYKRSDSITSHTLKTLHEGGVPLDRIYLYVADEEEFERYCTVLEEVPGVKVQIGVPGLTEQRWFIQNEWPEGQYIWMMDDDVKKFVYKAGSKIVNVTDVDMMIRSCFALMDQEGDSIVGLYPVPNGMFMKDEVTRNLRLLVGSAYGLRNTHSSWTRLTMGDDKEDHERTLLYYERHGMTTRVNYYCPVTKYYKNPGGLQETRSRESVQANVDSLLKRWPEYLAPAKPHKGTDMPEVRFRRIK